jgi:mannosyltransferase OCH1-like enzyme
MIHQIFINIGKGELKDIPQFIWFQKKTETYAEKKEIPYKLWGKKEIEDLMDENGWREFYDNLRYDIQRIDFARLVILYVVGGLYLDLDVYPFPDVDIKWIFLEDFFIARWNNSHLPYNAILGCKQGDPLMYKCIEEVMNSYEEKKDMEIYLIRKARFVFQTTGHYALHRVLKNGVKYSPVVSVLNNIKNISDCCPKGQAYFYDSSASVWYNDEFKQ